MARPQARRLAPMAQMYRAGGRPVWKWRLASQ
ncbi:protein of unknown function [Cupriavidus taiwanensis]|uniref:Uncharacterized protein n=1 Tax=Cupriavidus taiwanensis TaxID=164546 RepID=A0A7Z7JC73_9BURK|nr:protein of unknown function [Cupriavidus taiwanensis]SOZ05980.1 hypothetical protein CBM2595_A80665 [Cupriavidus taiwanensis]SOZ07965.1 hypothetical protein CBM2597_A90571 [Cupriavidus taiwanensis]SPC16002.1 hypothetical protein CBM2594_A70567 [Cupriavidus taiwanensis]SPD40701.1 protein of unknown function [Cupriavidus taiwanensis]